LRRLSKYNKYLLLALTFPILVLIINAFRIQNFSSQSFDTPSDVPIVLGAGSSKGVVSPVFQERINHGITLYQTGKVLMTREGFTSALIVSDPLHMKHAMAMCQALGMKALPAPTPSTMYRSWRIRFSSLVYEGFYYSLGIACGRY
jgi:uncharacterized SAM-binding protein YcdF (DUF218 family)